MSTFLLSYASLMIEIYFSAPLHAYVKASFNKFVSS